ncbi:MAG: tripartite tricarboxylate transporter TctB family protein [Litorivicinaceae bacterium]
MYRLFSPSNLVGATLLIYFVYVVVGSFEFSPLPGLFPLVVGGVGIFVIALHFGAKVVRRSELMPPDVGANAPGAVDFEITDDETSREGVRITIEQLAWIFGLFLGLWTLGFYLSVPVFVFAYLKRNGESWRLSLILAAVIAAVVRGLFNELLNLPFPQGVLISLFT